MLVNGQLRRFSVGFGKGQMASLHNRDYAKFAAIAGATALTAFVPMTAESKLLSLIPNFSQDGWHAGVFVISGMAYTSVSCHIRLGQVLPYLFFILFFCGLSSSSIAEDGKKRIFVVSSYDPSYLWSQSTHQGLMAAMLRYKYLDNPEQAKILTTQNLTESSRTVIKKVWMDTKRRNSSSGMADATLMIMKELRTFKPDLVMLGDDNAANYIGNQLLDSDIPVVFWGINGLPLKYGLVDSMDRPGHNVTGVWQAGYHKESLELLKHLVPGAETFAILACDSVSSRSNVKQIKSLSLRGKLPLKLDGVLVTNRLEEFKQGALALAQKVDAFFVLNHDTLRNERGEHIPMLEVGRWYLENIRKPEVSHEDQFVLEGMLSTANDSGFNQAFHAFEMAYDILEQGLNPGLMRTKTPPRGPFMVNRQRARMLGIDLVDKMEFIDEIVEKAVALQQ